MKSKFEFPELVQQELKAHWKFYHQYLNFKANVWAVCVLKMGAQPEIVARVLRRMAIGTVARTITNPWGWANKVLAELSKDKRFAEVLEEHEKREPLSLERAGDVLARIAKKGKVK